MGVNHVEAALHDQEMPEKTVAEVMKDSLSTALERASAFINIPRLRQITLALIATSMLGLNACGAAPAQPLNYDNTGTPGNPPVATLVPEVNYNLNETELADFLLKNITASSRSKHIIIGLGNDPAERERYRANFPGYEGSDLKTPEVTDFEASFNQAERAKIVKLNETLLKARKLWGYNTGIAVPAGSLTIKVANPFSKKKFMTDEIQETLDETAYIQINGIEVYKDKDGRAWALYRAENVYVGSAHDQVSGILFIQVPLEDSPLYLYMDQAVTSSLALRENAPSMQLFNAATGAIAIRDSLNTNWGTTQQISLVEYSGVTVGDAELKREGKYVMGLGIKDYRTYPTISGGGCFAYTMYYTVMASNGDVIVPLRHKNHSPSKGIKETRYWIGSVLNRDLARMDTTGATQPNGTPSPDASFTLVELPQKAFFQTIILDAPSREQAVNKPGRLIMLVSKVGGKPLFLK